MQEATKKNISIPKMWSVREAATETNTATSFIRKLIVEKKIKYIKTGKKYLINAESLCEYIKNCEAEEI